GYRSVLAVERLAAGPVADDVERVEVPRVARGVEEAVAAVRGALPDPPALVRIERCRLGLEGVRAALVPADIGRDRGGSLGLALARVGVALADVRGHARLRTARPAMEWEAGDGFV